MVDLVKWISALGAVARSFVRTIRRGLVNSHVPRTSRIP